MASLVSKAEMNRYFRDTFPDWDLRPEVTDMGDGAATVRLDVAPHHLRPGDYVGGPTQMSLADTVAFVAITTRIGITPMLVTSSLNMTFLRPLIGKAVEARAQVMKLGRALAVTDVHVSATGGETPSSHAVVTYAVPRQET